MPEGFPNPQGLTEEENAFNDTFFETMFGRVAASFTPNRVTNGNHPEEVRAAWVGVPLPIREEHVKHTHLGVAKVAAGEAYSALVAAGTSDDILSYWIRSLPQHADASILFRLEDGTLQYLHDRV